MAVVAVDAGKDNPDPVLVSEFRQLIAGLTPLNEISSPDDFESSMELPDCLGEPGICLELVRYNLVRALVIAVLKGTVSSFSLTTILFRR